MRIQRRILFWSLIGVLASGNALAQNPAATNKPYLPVGLFLGRVEEGARIFTPVRFFPFGHPEGGAHQFPTVQQLHGTEFPALIWLGSLVGMRLWATLERYPTEPATDWPYKDFAQPPDSLSLRSAEITHIRRAEAPMPGLRAVLYHDRQPILFIVDTRMLTLAERGMRGATAMGLDISRADFLKALDLASLHSALRGLGVVIYDP
jgi:hypothetical protein